MVNTSSQNDAESRFAHLLQPIRDLAKNWDIDLASQLEEYLSEIEKVTVTFDGGATTMNFAEAALLIQGSACVYSRKVEYLYSLVCQVLNLLGSNKKQQQQTSTSAGDNDINTNSNDDDEFLSLDDIREHNNITLKNDDDNNMNRVDVIPPTPAILLPVDEMLRTSTPLISRNGEVLASRNDFKMNTVTIDIKSGAALLDISLAALITDNLSPIRHTATGVTGGPPVSDVLAGCDAAAAACDLDEGCDLDMSSSEGAEMECDDDGKLADDNNRNDDQQQQQQRDHLSRNAAATKLNSKPAKQAVSYESFWEVDDPHKLNPTTAMLKPFKTGRVFKMPQKLTGKNVDERKRKRKINSQETDEKTEREQKHSTIVSLSEFINNEYFSRLDRLPGGRLKTLNFVDLEQIYWTRLKKNKTSRRHVAFKVNAEVVCGKITEDCEPLLPVNDDCADDGDDDDDCDDNEQFIIPDAAFGNTDVHNGVTTNVNINELCNNLSNVDIVSSYEELVRRHVEVFMASAQRYAQDTALARRVAEWQEKIEPRLRNEEQRRPFDIHVYGRELLTRLEALGGANKYVAFRQVVETYTAPEVCRYFLAGLQLANDRNVDIGCSGKLESSVDTATLKLLSTRQHCESLSSYQAPSLANR